MFGFHKAELRRWMKLGLEMESYDAEITWLNGELATFLFWFSKNMLVPVLFSLRGLPPHSTTPIWLIQFLSVPRDFRPYQGKKCASLSLPPTADKFKIRYAFEVCCRFYSMSINVLIFCDSQHGDAII
jgi:hypothetical protein